MLSLIFLALVVIAVLAFVLPEDKVISSYKSVRRTVYGWFGKK